MIEILKETARYLVCVKPIGIAAQGTQAEAMPQLLSEQLGCDILPARRPGLRKRSSCFPARSAAGSACWSAISPTTEKSERMNLKNSMPFWTRLRAAKTRGGESCWKFSFHRPF